MRAAARAAGHVIEYDREPDFRDRGHMAVEAFLGRLVVVGRDLQRGVSAGALRNPHRLQVAALAAVLFADPLAAVSRLTMANHERARQREMATPIRAGRAPRLSSCFQMRAVNVVHFETDCVGCWQRIKANAADDVETLTPVVATWMAHHREIELTD